MSSRSRAWNPVPLRRRLVCPYELINFIVERVDERTWPICTHRGSDCAHTRGQDGDLKTPAA